MKYPRLREVEEYVLKRDFVSLDELCHTFGKSKNTIRRDVSELVKNGAFEKVYGGVRTIKTPMVIKQSFVDRSAMYQAGKQSIGALAARFVADNDIVFLDSGTTTLHMLPHLAERSNVTLLTNNLHAINFCLEHPNINAISLGGQLNPATASFSSNYSPVDHLENFNIFKAFMAATGVSIEKGATNTVGELAIKKKIMERSDVCYLLVDSSKFDRSALLTYAELSAFHCVVTDTEPPARYLTFFRDNGIQVMMK
ncbi:MAG: DeoR/GlpR family DNA-binding transcription regulator [Planctomycetota bacterium]|jgi:DeoR family myo-inositol catabolism operon transcriptional repressor|nr:DeoR/GlpR family DNA-binding transcription regulator [Planctomycetota bacterium]